MSKFVKKSDPVECNDIWQVSIGHLLKKINELYNNSEKSSNDIKVCILSNGI